MLVPLPRFSVPLPLVLLLPSVNVVPTILLLTAASVRVPLPPAEVPSVIGPPAPPALKTKLLNEERVNVAVPEVLCTASVLVPAPATSEPPPVMAVETAT